MLFVVFSAYKRRTDDGPTSGERRTNGGRTTGERRTRLINRTTQLRVANFVYKKRVSTLAVVTSRFVIMATGSEAAGMQRERRHAADMKTGAIKQIEAWAKSGREQKVECGRNVGKLNDNVTEERMLQARIWDLSRERYKFLSQADYEKRTFLDRQLRKTAICREITRTMECNKGSELGGGSGGEMQRALARRESVKSLSKSISHARAASGRANSGAALHLPVVHRRTKHGQLTTGSAASNEDLSFRNGHDSDSDVVPDQSRSMMFPTEPTHPIRYKSNLVMREALGANIRSAPVKRRISFAADQPEHKGHHRRNRQCDQQQADVKPMEDPRYQLLENCLCEKWSRKGMLAAPEVAGVIKGNPSLYLPPKRGKDRKSSIAVKFLKLLSEQGWVF
ncbi:hypothetical protein LSH36_977g00023 [Paralvinella palmiformis]|uniref:Uncharacterized protein n=1 Tax=Paralvinella palmiformis TaxID=53620 RepID=A0AAD9IX33_9ANNE|nr:hypothetical protein LSH36_977g00023 [Paralvinella palmiformis]